MKKGMAELGLVIFGVVTIIAIIGLVLLFTKAGTTGESVYQSSDSIYGKAYVNVRGGLSYDKAHFIILDARIEKLPQCRTIWGQRLNGPQGYPISQNAISCYQVFDQAQHDEVIRKYNLVYGQSPEKMKSDILCFLNDLGYGDLNWMNPADKVCIPDQTARFNPN